LPIGDRPPEEEVGAAEARIDWRPEEGVGAAEAQLDWWPAEEVGAAEAEMESIMDWAAGRRGRWC
jgi:hypothetical protein